MLTEAQKKKFKDLLETIFECIVEQLEIEHSRAKLLAIFKPHTDALAFFKVQEVNWYGCVRESLGKPLWTWHEIWTMANDRVEHNETHRDFVGLVNAILEHCAWRDKELEPPLSIITECDVKFAIQ